MKRINLIVLFYCISFSVFVQENEVQRRLLLNNSSDSTIKPSVSQIYNNFYSLLSNPDSTVNHDKKMADRWMRYVFSKYDITSENQYSNEAYSRAISSIYSSPLNCGSDDPADWKSDGPVNMSTWQADASSPFQQNGGMVTGIYNNPYNVNECIVGTLRSGIFRTTDGGVNWSSVTDHLPFPVLGIKQIIASPNTAGFLFAITGTENIKGGVIYSIDMGVTWQQVNQNLPQFNWIDFHPTQIGLAFAATDDDIMCTRNYGATWQSMGVPPGYHDVDPDNSQLLYSTFRYFHKIIVFENSLLTSNYKRYTSNADLYKATFTLGTTIIPTWVGDVSSNFVGTNNLIFCDFSNKVNERSYIQVSYNHPIGLIFKTEDDGQNYTQINIPNPSFEDVNTGKNILIASPNNSNTFYLGSIKHIRKYDDLTGNYSQILGDITNTGHHDDNRCYQILSNANQDRILVGNDGGAALIENGLDVLPTIKSLNGNLSISLLHSFDVHEKTGRIAYAFQDHPMRYRDVNLNFSTTFIWEGKVAMIQEDYPDAIVGGSLYSGIYDRDEFNNPIVNGTLGLSYGNVTSCFIKYRHFPNRFAAGFGYTNPYPYGKVAMNRAANVSVLSNINASPSIGEVAICERNPNIIFAGDYEKNTQEFRFFRSIDDGYNWTSLNPLVFRNGVPIALNLLLAWKTINAIAVDHSLNTNNEATVFIGLSGTYEENSQITDEKFRVLKSINNGVSFMDYSEGLPVLPVEKLLIVESDNKLMFCATSVGIYYRTNTMSRWECFSKNLPKVEITDMEYNYCEKTLYVSTYGRGIWKSIVNLNTDNTFKEEILTSTTWNSARHLKNNLLIKNGATLTITSTIAIGNQRKIFIEPGAKLVLDGGTLTSECNTFWEGIEIWGNNSSQQNILTQGNLVLKNGATIENARNAVRVWKVDDWNSGGGIINASNSYFKNNWRSIEYMPYHSYLNNGNEVPNKGKIINCEFTWDDGFFDTRPEAAITLYHINGVVITGSDFIDNRTGNVGTNNRPFGIYSIDAGYKVLGRYLLDNISVNQDEYYSEVNYDVNHFKNLQRGIQAMNSSTQFNVMIDHSKFEDMDFGIDIRSMDNSIITRNKFDFNINRPSNFHGMVQTIVSHSTGFKVEGNVFENQDLNNGVIGCISYNTGFEQNSIYRNNFKKLQAGNFAIGQNTNDLTGTSPVSGLQFLCNGYRNTTHYDQLVGSFIPSAGNGNGIRLKQGTSTSPAGNSFSVIQANEQGKIHFSSDDLDNIYYYHSSQANHIPTIKEGNITNQSTVPPSSSCPSSFNRHRIGVNPILSTVDKSMVVNELNDVNNRYQQKLIELNDILASHDTPNLHTLVANLNASNKGSVKTELMNHSPYLSEALLVELGEKAPALFPYSWYKDLIIANIEIAQNKTFINYLETRTNPLPSGLITQIEAERNASTTARGVKVDELSDLLSKKSELLNALIQNELSDSAEINWTAFNDWLTQRNDIVCLSQKADMHLGKNEIDLCTDKLDYIDVHINEYLVPEIQQEMMDYTIFKRYVLTITNQHGVIERLDENQIQQLQFMADNFKGKASNQASNILCFHARICKDVPYSINSDKNKKLNTSKQEQKQFVSDTNSEDIIIKPNPSDGNFEVLIPETCEIAAIKIVGVDGKDVDHNISDMNMNKLNFSLKNSAIGLYLIEVKCSDKTSYKTRVLIK